MEVTIRDRNANLYEVNSLVATKIVTPQTEAVYGKKYIASVKKANEKNNYCDIVYRDEDKVKTYKTKVPADLSSFLRKDFPRQGDKVVIRLYGDNAIITDIVETDMNRIKARNTIHADRYANASLCINTQIIPGGAID